MNNLSEALLAPISWLFGAPQASSAATTPRGAASHQLLDLPPEEDTLAVFSTLECILPAEVVYIILDYACYWKKAASFKHEPSPRPLRIMAPSFDNGYGKGQCILLTERLSCDLVSKIRAVAFSFESADQGWGGDIGASGVYGGSWTWFDTVIVRDSGKTPEEITHDLNNQAHHQKGFNNIAPQEEESQMDEPTQFVWEVQHNRRAEQELHRHKVIWKWDGVQHAPERSHLPWDMLGTGDGIGFLSTIRENDRIAVIANARFGGWVNEVASVELEIFSSLG